MSEIYINGAGAISPQPTFEGSVTCEIKHGEVSRLKAIEPDYKEFINSRSARRLSRVIKMGIASALTALKDADLRLPDAVIAGTAYGCMVDTEKFLSSMIENDEKYLNPASFIYSTHNTISSQVALQLKCTGYNQTYSHGATSFETALLDGSMLLSENGVQTVLVGGIDEMTDNLFAITARFGLWKRQPGDHLEIFSSQTKGSIPGEEAIFLLLGNRQTQSSYAKLLESTTLHGSISDSELEGWMRQVLSRNQLGLDDLDLCFLGKNGDIRFDGIYDRLEKGLLKSISCVNFKHLCGETPTVSSFACWLAANLLKKQEIPESIHPHQTEVSGLNNILIYNQDRNCEHGLILLQSC
jgi:3-oxoacyl-[acyl-carrier-protein] synthase II